MRSWSIRKIYYNFIVSIKGQRPDGGKVTPRAVGLSKDALLKIAINIVITSNYSKNVFNTIISIGIF